MTIDPKKLKAMVESDDSDRPPAKISRLVPAGEEVELTDEQKHALENEDDAWRSVTS